MTDEPDLFGFNSPAEYPDAPGHRGVETSIAAAADIAPKLGRLQRIAEAAIRAAGDYGASLPYKRSVRPIPPAII